MGTSEGIAKLPVEDLIGGISSAEVSPGAGAAGAVALALAAACACKAVSITLKHRPEESALRSAADCFRQVARFALTDADRDSAAFAEFMRSRSSSAVGRLIEEGERVAQLIGTSERAINEFEPFITTNVSGDLVAAKALVCAARRVQEHDQAEALQNR